LHSYDTPPVRCQRMGHDSWQSNWHMLSSSIAHTSQLSTRNASRPSPQTVSLSSTSSQGLVAALTTLGSMQGISLWSGSSTRQLQDSAQKLISEGTPAPPRWHPSGSSTNLRALDQCVPAPSTLGMPEGRPSLPAVEPGMPSALEEPIEGRTEDVMQCSRGNTYQPSKRKRVNKHGLRQR
jgi:hypothetical protein